MIRSLVVAFGLLTSFALGQEAQLVKTTLLTFGLGAPPEGFTAFFKSDEEIFEFNATGNGLGVPARYRGPQRLILHRTKEDFKVTEGQAPKAPLAFVDLPNKADTVLVLAAIEGPDKVRLAAFDVSTGTLRAGDYKLFNFSHSTLSMIMQKQKFSLAPGKDIKINDASWQEKAMALPIEIATVSGKTVTPVYSSFLEHFPQRRNIVFLFDGRRKNQPIAFTNFAVDPPIKDPAPAQ